MRKLLLVLATIGLIGALAAPTAAAGGFDALGYNRSAHIFNGPADGNDGVIDGTLWGDPTYAKDKLVLKWNAAWDACNAAGNLDPAACSGAWETNEWNGKVSGGSGSVWHYKIAWSSICVAGGTPTDGGYCIWGGYEVLMDQGTDSSGHQWYA